MAAYPGRIGSELPTAPSEPRAILRYKGKAAYGCSGLFATQVPGARSDDSKKYIDLDPGQSGSYKENE
jgi:hypothetical protein